MFRYEKKYMVVTGQQEFLRNHIEELCFRDSHTDGTNRYVIRSLYFDDYGSNAYYDNENGIDPRTKYRIRIYNNDTGVIHLERKVKQAGKIHKDRVIVDKEFCDLLLSGNGDQIDYPTEEPLVNRFLTLYHTCMLRPSIIVEYEREPYVYPDGDVRITFDRKISFSDELERFFEPDIFLQPILPSGQDVLEVKYTEFMPEFIQRELEMKQMQQCAFSKFYLCEKYRRSGVKYNDI